jgi:uncharacterized Zn finger protein
MGCSRRVEVFSLTELSPLRNVTNIKGDEMPECPKCSENLSRTHRKFWEKPIYSIVFRCHNCNHRVGARHDFFKQFSRTTLCPRCGNLDVEKRRTKDRIDKLIHTPFSTLNRLLGGNLYHCVFCRLQYYDVRSRRTKAKEAQKPVAPQTV